MKKIVEAIPVISTLLLFVGYVNYITYYNYFNIDIITYLSTGELLLSFLPLTWPILFVVLLIVIIFIVEIVIFPGEKAKNTDGNERPKKLSVLTIYLSSEMLKIIKNDLRSKEPKTIQWFIGICFAFIFFVVGVAIIIYFIFFPLLMLPIAIESKPFPEWNHGDFIMCCILWFLLLFDIIMVAEERKKIGGTKWINLFFVACAFICILTIGNKMKATDVLNRRSTTGVKFTFNDSLIITDSNLTYIGRTSNFLFLRNLNNKRNFIFLAADIKSLETWKIDLPTVSK